MLTSRMPCAFLAFLWLSSSGAAQNTWYVDANATPPGSGSSISPYASLQQALASATTLPGDTILVLPGLYSEAVDFLGKDVRVQSRDGAGVTTIDANGLYQPVVAFMSGESAAAELVGFTLTRGSGHDDGSRLLGGGLYIAQSSPTVRDCVIVANEADLGGGVHGEGGAPRFVGCLFESNRSFAAGDGVSFESSAPVFEDCTIRYHSSQAIAHAGILSGSTASFERCVVTFNGGIDYATGGLRILAGSDVEFSECDFRYNISDPQGGALYIDASSVTLVDCSFTSNYVLNGYYGGAIQCDSGQILATRCSFVSNFSTRGGAVYSEGAGLFEECEFIDNWAQCENLIGSGDFGAMFATAGTTVRRSVFVGNRALGSCSSGHDGEGGAVGGGLTLEHCTLVGNSAHRFGAVEFATLRNCIVWGNVPETMAGATSATYCALEFPVPGTGNLGLDPLLWGGVGPNLHLRAGSACIDSGDPTSPLDPDGSRADIGAFAFDSGYLPPITHYCSAKTSSAGCVPHMESSGSPHLSGPDDLEVTAYDVLNQKSGLLLWGLAPRSAPFLGGTLCVGSPIRRTQPTWSGGSSTGTDCSGWFRFHLSHTRFSAWGLSAGSRLYTQYWYRDPGFPAPTNVGLTDALEITLGP